MIVTLYKRTVSKLLLFACLLTGEVVIGQQYPVQIVPQLQAPYTLNLSDYYNGTQEKLVVLLTNTDLNKPAMEVRLRMSIQGQVAKLVSRDNMYYPPIQLDAGIPHRITLGDLAPYFNADNLIFQGITRAQYVQSGKLPEGFYQFCFEAVETGSNQVVGRSSCAMAWISLNDPPLLNLPVKAESIVYKDPQNIIFQWTPRNYNSPVSAFNTEYEFTLVELWDNGVAPEAAFGTAQPFYRTTTKSTTLLYGPAEPLLLTGHRYAWRIRAQPPEGTEGGDVWRNNGYSEIYWFTCQNNCAAPLNIQAEIKSGGATITWAPNPNQTAFLVDYREKGQAAATWYSSTTNTSRMVLNELKKEKTYEYRVGGTCDNGNTYTYSDIKTLSMGKDSAVDSTCGILTAEPNIANRKAIQTLMVDDVIVAGDFPVKLTQVSGQSSFAGAGYVTVPFLGQNRVKVKFSKITVNTDKQLIGGYIETSYDSTEKQIANLDQVLDGGKDVGIVRTGVDTAGYYIDLVIPGVENIKVEMNAPSDNNGHSTSGGATLIITGADGKVKEVKVDQLPTTIKDKAGTVYGIDKEGTVTKISEQGNIRKMTAAALNTLQPAKAVVRFVPHTDQQYAFDVYQPVYANSNLFNEKYEKLAGEYYVNAKLVVEAKADIVNAVVQIKDPKLKADSIRFITGKGIRYDSKRLTDSTWEIPIVGGPGGDAQELYALYPNTDTTYLSLGKLLIASYKQQNRKLVLVPVNGAKTDKAAISEQLNKIYNPVAVTFEVTQDADFNDTSWDLDGDTKLAVSGSNWLSTQTNEMKALNSAYAKARTVQNDAIYLFVMNSSDSSIAGDMPRGKQFGYLFKSADGHAAAHETGHGVFQLKHVFDDYGFKQGQLPSNVMDYPAGDHFTKYQWDALHAPGIVISLFEKPEDAELRVGKASDFEKLKNVTTGTYTFLSPGGFPVTLPATATNINLSETNYFNSTSEKDSLRTVSFGTLIAFSLPAKDTTKTIRYSTIGENGQKVNESGTFMGYYYSDSSGRKPYIDNLSAKETERNVIIAFPSIHAYDNSYTIKARWAQIPEERWKKAHDSDYKASGHLVDALVYLGDIAIKGYENSRKIPVYDISGSMQPYSEFKDSKEATKFLIDNTFENVMPLPVIMHIANQIKLHPVEYNRFVCSRDRKSLTMPTSYDEWNTRYSDLEKMAYAYLNEFNRFIETVKMPRKKLDSITDLNEIKSLLGNRCEWIYNDLSAEERIQVLKVYTKESNWITGCIMNELNIEDPIKCEEAQLIQILNSIPDNQQAVAIADFLNHNLPVLYRLVKDVDRGRNREAMMKALFELFKKKDPRNAFNRGDLLGNRLFSEAHFDYGLKINDKIDFATQNGRYWFTINRIKVQENPQKYKLNIKDNGYEWINYILPFDAVTVVFGEDFTLPNNQTLFSKGDIVRMPALYLWHMNDVDGQQTAALLRENAIKFIASVDTYAGLALEVNTAEYVLQALEELHEVYTSKIRPTINPDNLDVHGRKMLSNLDKLVAGYELYNEGKEWFDVLKEVHDLVNDDEFSIKKLKEYCQDGVKEIVLDKVKEIFEKLITEPANIVSIDWKSGWKYWEDYGKEIVNDEVMAIIGDRYYSREAVKTCVDNRFSVMPTDIEDAMENGTAYIKDDGLVRQKVYDYDQIRVITDVDGINNIVRTVSLVKWDETGLPAAVKNITFRGTRNINVWTDERLLLATKEAFHDANIKNKDLFKMQDGAYTGVTKEGYNVDFKIKQSKIESITVTIIP